MALCLDQEDLIRQPTCHNVIIIMLTGFIDQAVKDVLQSYEDYCVCFQPCPPIFCNSFCRDIDPSDALCYYYPIICDIVGVIVVTTALVGITLKGYQLLIVFTSLDGHLLPK